MKSKQSYRQHIIHQYPQQQYVAIFMNTVIEMFCQKNKHMLTLFDKE
jgi:hypothetical protein